MTTLNDPDEPHGLSDAGEVPGETEFIPLPE